MNYVLAKRFLCYPLWFVFEIFFCMSTHALTEDESRHLLLRVGFGMNPELIDWLPESSREEAVYRLLHSSSRVMPPPACLASTISSQSLKVQWDDSQLLEYRKKRRSCSDDFRRKYIESISTSSAVLDEHMAFFWSNHFTSSLEKVRTTALIFRQYQLFRSNSIWDFRTLLHSVINDPAMLMYLDNVTNTKKKPNENLARELLELFTLGEGHYTEADVKAAARALTGQSVEMETYGVRFYPERHDYGENSILGEKGYFGPEGLVELLLRQPQTAQFITRKVWLEFVSTPDERQIRKLAKEFGKTWDIAALVKGVLLSDAFWADQGKMIKSPLELVVGTERLLPGMQVPAKAIPPLLEGLGQKLFSPPNVKGWPGGKDWIDASRMMMRINFAERAMRGVAQEATPKELAYICAEGGPARFAALPEKVSVDKSLPCIDQLAAVLTDPVWQLK